MWKNAKSKPTCSRFSIRNVKTITMLQTFSFCVTHTHYLSFVLFWPLGFSSSSSSLSSSSLSLSIVFKCFDNLRRVHLTGTVQKKKWNRKKNRTKERNTFDTFTILHKSHRNIYIVALLLLLFFSLFFFFFTSVSCTLQCFPFAIVDITLPLLFVACTISMILSCVSVCAHSVRFFFFYFFFPLLPIHANRTLYSCQAISLLFSSNIYVY